MVTIGVTPHKQTHTAPAVNELGVEVGHRTVPATAAGNGQLLESGGADLAPDTLYHRVSTGLWPKQSAAA